MYTLIKRINMRENQPKTTKIYIREKAREELREKAKARKDKLNEREVIVILDALLTEKNRISLEIAYRTGDKIKCYFLKKDLDEVEKIMGKVARY